jgi:hypothetical protein
MTSREHFGRWMMLASAARLRRAKRGDPVRSNPGEDDQS